MEGLIVLIQHINNSGALREVPRSINDPIHVPRPTFSRLLPSFKFRVCIRYCQVLDMPSLLHLGVEYSSRTLSDWLLLLHTLAEVAHDASSN